MSNLEKPSSCYLFYSVIWNEEVWNRKKVLSLLETKHNFKASELTPEYNPSFEYYSKEMGPKLNRMLFAFQKLSLREEMLEYKLWATQVENEFLIDGQRTINIDVGLLSLENLVLSTGKPFGHRVYIGHGIYGDLNYIFKKKKVEFFPWTYPDYKEAKKVNWFLDLRKHLLDSKSVC